MTLSVEICATTAIASVVVANVVHSFYRIYWEYRKGTHRPHAKWCHCCGKEF